MAKFNYKSVLMCEDIRHETGGRVSLMGILGSKLYVQEFPLFFPKFCLFIEWGEIDGKMTVKMKISAPEGVQLPNVQPTAEIRGQPGIPARSMIVLNGFMFPKPGEYVFEFLVDDQTVGKEILRVEKYEQPPTVTN